MELIRRFGTIIVWLLIGFIGLTGVFAHFLLPDQTYAEIVRIFSESVYQQELALAESPIANNYHRILGLAFFVVGMLQFNRGLRTKKPTFHRWCGRVYILLALVVIVTASILALRHAFAGMFETVSTLVIKRFFCVFVLLGFFYGRRKNFRSHRNYMIRGFAVALFVAFQRPYFFSGLLFLNLPAEMLFIISGVAALFSSVLAAELWIWLSKDHHRLTPPRLQKPQSK